MSPSNVATRPPCATLPWPLIPWPRARSQWIGIRRQDVMDGESGLTQSANVPPYYLTQLNRAIQGQWGAKAAGSERDEILIPKA
jgi:hypothetical protein